jgi:enoyl-CoA hydratase/carnithine racemase
MPEPDPALLARGGLRLAREGAVATVTLDRPSTRNAQTPATWEALRAIGAGLDDDVRVVVVRGAGGTFSSGLDLRSLDPAAAGAATSIPALLDLPDEELAARIGTWQEGFTWLRRPDLLTVAAVRGPAVGAGFQLALACDLRVLAEDARLSMREPALGLVPDLTGTKPLVDCVGYPRALEICVTARWVTAHEALDLGLATAVVPPGELDDAVAALVTALTAPPRGAVLETKALLRAAAERGLEDQRRAEREAQVRRLRDLFGRGGGPGR